MKKLSILLIFGVIALYSATSFADAIKVNTDDRLCPKIGMINGYIKGISYGHLGVLNKGYQVFFNDTNGSYGHPGIAISMAYKPNTIEFKELQSIAQLAYTTGTTVTINCDKNKKINAMWTWK